MSSVKGLTWSVRPPRRLARQCSNWRNQPCSGAHPSIKPMQIDHVVVSPAASLGEVMERDGVLQRSASAMNTHAMTIVCLDENDYTDEQTSIPIPPRRRLVRRLDDGRRARSRQVSRVGNGGRHARPWCTVHAAEAEESVQFRRGFAHDRVFEHVDSWPS